MNQIIETICKDNAIFVFALILVFIAALCALSGGFGLIQYILRAFNIAKHGWPPAHLDADGDFKSEDADDDDED